MNTAAPSPIRNRIEKNAKALAPWAQKLKLDAYRIYERDIPEYPYIIDRYGEYYVVYDRGSEWLDQQDKKRGHFPELLDALKSIFSTDDEHIIVKRRERQKGESQYEKIAATNNTMVINEGPAKFVVNLHDYLDTGLFLDHRIMRERIFKESQGKDFLNLFCYTGSVSVFAALGGARTVSVDMSVTYSKWAQENFRVNGLDLNNHEFITENALEFLAHSSTSRKFDMIFLDPPTFSNSKKMDSTFEVERDQEFLVDQCMKLLKPGGVLYFSNNKRTFKLNPRLSSDYQVKDISSKTIPKDFRDLKIHYVFEIRARS